MGVKVKHRVDKYGETPRIVHTWSTEINGYDVVATREGDDGLFEVSIFPQDYKRGARLGLVKFYPRHLSHFEQFADEAAELLRGMAIALREAVGTDDMRSRMEKISEKIEARYDAIITSVADKARGEAKAAAAKLLAGS